MLRFHVAHLLRAREEAEGRTIPLREVSAATGISVSVLSSLASPRAGATTNTRFVEALCRYFCCEPSDLLELVPSLEEETRCHIDNLYPARGAHRAREQPP
jgi:putative transcriptional regulator